MKALLTMFLILKIINSAFGQTVLPVEHVDTSQLVLFHQLVSGIGKRPEFWIVNDEPLKDTLVDAALKSINPSDILEVRLLRYTSKAELTSSAIPPLSQTCIVVTRRYAIAQYQKKLSAFSTEYKKEVEFQMKYNHNDNGIFYVIIIDGGAQYFNQDDLIRKLYDTPTAQIIKVDFSKQQTCCGVNKWFQVFLKQSP